MNIISLFSGAGGLDLGFERVGFRVIWANEFDRDIHATYLDNFGHVEFAGCSILDIHSSEIPDCDGIIGGPPCQSFSVAGAGRGIKDKRGQLFFEFIRILKAKQPKFFLVENVAGMLAKKHAAALKSIQQQFLNCGYNVTFKLLNAADYGVPQDRRRVFFIGYREDLNKTFKFPQPKAKQQTLRDAIFDIKDNAMPALSKGHTNHTNCALPNHEYLTGGFSSMYMSRNRVRTWDEPSFTIQASGRHAPIHPTAPKMQRINQNQRMFEKNKEYLYRRLSIRECARIQTFPDNHILTYKSLVTGYKMIGNAVPPKLSYEIAQKIFIDMM